MDWQPIDTTPMPDWWLTYRRTRVGHHVDRYVSIYSLAAVRSVRRGNTEKAYLNAREAARLVLKVWPRLEAS